MEIRAETSILLLFSRTFVYSRLLNFARCSLGIQISIDHIQTHTRTIVRNIVQTNFRRIFFFCNNFSISGFSWLFIMIFGANIFNRRYKSSTVSIAGLKCIMEMTS